MDKFGDAIEERSVALRSTEDSSITKTGSTAESKAESEAEATPKPKPGQCRAAIAEKALS